MQREPAWTSAQVYAREGWVRCRRCESVAQIRIGQRARIEAPNGARQGLPNKFQTLDGSPHGYRANGELRQGQDATDSTIRRQMQEQAQAQAQQQVRRRSVEAEWTRLTSSASRGEENGRVGGLYESRRSDWNQ